MKAEEILRTKTCCTITEEAPDEDEFQYFEWKHAIEAMQEYATLVTQEKDEEIKRLREALEVMTSAANSFAPRMPYWDFQIHKAKQALKGEGGNNGPK
jgi:hypothetical protein